MTTTPINTAEIGAIVDETNTESQFYAVVSVEGLEGTTAGVIYNTAQYRFQFRKTATEKAEVGASGWVLYEDRDNGVDAITFKAPTAVPVPYTITLPATPPSTNSTFVIAADGTSTFQPAVATASALSPDGLYHILTSIPSGLVDELPALTNDQVFLGMSGAAPTARSFSPSTSTSWDLSGGTIKVELIQEITPTSTPTFVGMTLTGFSGVLKASAGVLSASTLVNADIANNAAITISKLEDLPSGQIIVGNATDTPTAVAMSGEATISDLGVVTLDNDSVIDKTLTGYTAAAGVITSADSIVSAIEKLEGNAQTTSLKPPVADYASLPLLGNVIGDLRLTLDTNNMFSWTAGLTWERIQNYGNSITVAKTGAQFSTITEALDSITDASISNPYNIIIYPGTYVESIVLKSYVCLSGTSTGTGNTVIQSDTSVVTGTLAEDFTHTISHLAVILVPTIDGQRCVDVTGNFGMIDCFCFIQANSDIETGSIRASGTTLLALSSTSQVYVNTYVGLTKDYTCLEIGGAGQLFHTVSSQRISVNAVSGVHRMMKLTGIGEVLGATAVVIYDNTASTGTVEVIGCEIDALSPFKRIYEYSDWRFTGGGAGTCTAILMNPSSGADFFFSGMTISIDGFANEYLCDNNTAGNTLKIWLNSTNKNLAKIGLGLSIVTPYDEVRSGFVEWSSVGGSTWSFVPGTGVFSLIKRATGIVKSSPVIIDMNQDVTLTDNAINYVYSDSVGTLASTITPTDALYTDNIPLFEVYSDSTNYMVKKENHPVSFNVGASTFIHKTLGSLLYNNGNGNLTTLVAASRTVQMVGATELLDHGLITILPDSAGAAISFTSWFIGASGAEIDSSGITAIPSKWQNTATTVANAANNDRIVVRVGALLDSVNTTTPQYVYSYHNAVYGSNSAAAAAIASGLINAFPGALLGLEVVQLGFVTIQANGSGGGTIIATTISKQVVGANFVTGSSTSAGTTITDTTSFDKILSAADTSVQLALNTLDEHVHGTTGAVVGTTNVQVLTNKDYDGGTASNTSRITVPQAALTTISGLTRKEGTILYATDTDTLYVDDGTQLKAVGAGSVIAPITSAGAVNLTLYKDVVYICSNATDIVLDLSSVAGGLNAGSYYVFKNNNPVGGFKVTLNPNGSETINGSTTSWDLWPQDAVTLVVYNNELLVI